MGVLTNHSFISKAYFIDVYGNPIDVAPSCIVYDESNGSSVGSVSRIEAGLFECNYTPDHNGVWSVKWTVESGVRSYGGLQYFLVGDGQESLILSVVNDVESYVIDEQSHIHNLLDDLSIVQSGVVNIAGAAGFNPSTPLSGLQSTVEWAQSVTESKLDVIAGGMGFNPSVPLSIIQSEVEALALGAGFNPSVPLSAIESKLDGPVLSHLVAIHGGAGFNASVPLSVIRSEVEALALGAGFNPSVPLSEIESKIEGPITSHLVHIHSDVDTAKSDIQALLTDVSIVRWVLDGNIHDNVSLIESKIEGPVYSQLQGIKVDIAGAISDSIAISLVESKLDLNFPVISQTLWLNDIHMNTALNELSAIESKLDANFSEVLVDGQYKPLPLATFWQAWLIESKIDGSVYSYLVNIQDDTEHLTSWIQGVKVDVSDVESKLDGPITSHLVAIRAAGGFNPSVPLSEIESKIEGPIYSQLQGIKVDIAAVGGFNPSVALSEMESKIEGPVLSHLINVHNDTLFIPDVQSDVHAAGSRIQHVKTQQDIGYNKSVASSEALRTADSLLDDVQSHAHAIHIDVDQVESYLVDEQSHVHNIASGVRAIHQDTVLLTTYVTKSVASSEALRSVDSILDNVNSRVTHVKSDIESAKSEVRHVKGQQDTGYTTSVAGSVALRTVDSLVDDVQSHVHAIHVDVDQVESYLLDEQSHIHNIVSDVRAVHQDTVLLTTYVTKSVAASEALRSVDSLVDNVNSRVTHVKSDVEVGLSRLVNIQDDTEHLPSWVQGTKDDVAALRIRSNEAVWSRDTAQINLSAIAYSYALGSAIVGFLPASPSYITAYTALKVDRVENTNNSQNGVNTSSMVMEIDTASNFPSPVTAMYIPNNALLTPGSAVFGAHAQIGTENVKAELAGNATYWARLNYVLVDQNFLVMKNTGWALRITFLT